MIKLSSELTKRRAPSKHLKLTSRTPGELQPGGGKPRGHPSLRKPEAAWVGLVPDWSGGTAPALAACLRDWNFCGGVSIIQGHLTSSSTMPDNEFNHQMYQKHKLREAEKRNYPEDPILEWSDMASEIIRINMFKNMDDKIEIASKNWNLKTSQSHGYTENGKLKNTITNIQNSTFACNDVSETAE